MLLTVAVYVFIEAAKTYVPSLRRLENMLKISKL